MAGSWPSRARAEATAVTCFSTRLFVVVLLLVILVLQHTSDARQVCIVDIDDNTRTGSLFTRGMLEAFGSEHKFASVRAESPTPPECDESAVWVRRIRWKQVASFCNGGDACIVSSDEDCYLQTLTQNEWDKMQLHSRQLEYQSADDGWELDQESTGTVQGLRSRPAFRHSGRGSGRNDSILALSTPRATNNNDAGSASALRMLGGDAANDRARLKQEKLELRGKFIPPNASAQLRNGLGNVILRQYYSSKYPFPGIPLGPRYQFEPVSKAERQRAQRSFLFNFLGSVRAGLEPDRELMQEVLRNNTWPEGATAIHIFDELVRDPTLSDQGVYRQVLLNSSFTLAPVGTADDCFRFWEAIEAGSIPVFVRRMPSPESEVMKNCPDSFEDVLGSNPPIVLLDSWTDLPGFMASVTEEDIARRAKRLALWSDEFWRNTTRVIDQAINAFVARGLKYKPLPPHKMESANIAQLREADARQHLITPNVPDVVFAGARASGIWGIGNRLNGSPKLSMTFESRYHNFLAKCENQRLGLDAGRSDERRDIVKRLLAASQFDVESGEDGGADTRGEGYGIESKVSNPAAARPNHNPRLDLLAPRNLGAHEFAVPTIDWKWGSGSHIGEAVDSDFVQQLRMLNAKEIRKGGIPGDLMSHKPYKKKVTHEGWMLSQLCTPSGWGAVLPKSQPDTLIAELSPDYLSYSGVVQMLATLAPRAKVVVALRDPLERAFAEFTTNHQEDYSLGWRLPAPCSGTPHPGARASSFRCFIYYEPDAAVQRDFVTTMESALRNLTGAMSEGMAGEQTESLAAEGTALRSDYGVGYLLQGLYVSHLNNLLTAMPPEQVLVLTPGHNLRKPDDDASGVAVQWTNSEARTAIRFLGGDVGGASSEADNGRHLGGIDGNRPPNITERVRQTAGPLLFEQLRHYFAHGNVGLCALLQSHNYQCPDWAPA